MATLRAGGTEKFRTRECSIRKQVRLLDDVKFGKTHGEAQHCNRRLLRNQHPQQRVEKKKHGVDGMQTLHEGTPCFRCDTSGSARTWPLKYQQSIQSVAAIIGVALGGFVRSLDTAFLAMSRA
jgi:hypothetical protein